MLIELRAQFSTGNTVKEVPTSVDWEVARILVEGYFNALDNTPPSCPMEAIEMEMIFQSFARLNGVEAKVIRNQAIENQLKGIGLVDHPISVSQQEIKDKISAIEALIASERMGPDRDPQPEHLQLLHELTKTMRY